MQESAVVTVGWWSRRSRGSGVAASPSTSTFSGGIVGLDLRKKAIFSLSRDKECLSNVGSPMGRFLFEPLQTVKCIDKIYIHMEH